MYFIKMFLYRKTMSSWYYTDKYRSRFTDFCFLCVLISFKMVETCCPATYTLGNSAPHNPEKV